MAFITMFEGDIPTPYKDSLGNTTVGIGLNISDPTVRKIVERGGADMAFTNLVVESIQDVNTLIPNITGVAKLVMVSMRFNLGHHKFCKFEKMITAARNKEWDKVAHEMKNSKWYHQVGRRGPHHVSVISNLTKE